MRKRLAWLILLALVLVTLAGCNPAPPVASVNGEVIRRDELDNQVTLMIAQFENTYGITIDTKKDTDLVNEARQQALSYLIDLKLQLQEADRRGIEADKKEVSQSLSQLKTALGGDEGYKSFLSDTKLTDKDVNRMLRDESRVSKLYKEVTGKVQVSDSEAESYFNSNRASYDTPRQIRVSHILVASEDEARDIIAALDKGQDFATLAKEKSTDPGSKDSGGDLGWISENSPLDPAFLAAALDLKAGSYTKTPVQSSYGYHVIKCFEEKPAEQAVFTRVKSQVKEDLLEQKKSKTYSDFVAGLKKKAKIETYKENLEVQTTTGDKEE